MYTVNWTLKHVHVPCAGTTESSSTSVPTKSTALPPLRIQVTTAVTKAGVAH